ncbi:MAG: N-acetylmuramoyl-L-alanine amidase [Deferrisomatales bacterium]|nr:N-acetylmuramoyl-L-alanine amidase [Deferrisomatales bacterium]
MSDSRPLLRPRVLLWLPLLLAAVCWGVPAAGAALRVEARGVEPFVLEAAITENSTAWYDAEGWLRQFPGEVTWDAGSGRLSYRDGGSWVVLAAHEPYVLRNGLPLPDALPVRRGEGGLLVSEAFLRRTGPVLLGRDLRLVAAADRERRRVVVDAGHGGESGSRGDAGGGTVLEKDVVLELALTTAEELRRSGFAVHLTRSGDHSIAAEKRAAVANYWGAELFVSFHAAGQERPQARGFEVFVAPAPDPSLAADRWQAGQAGQAAASRRWAAALRATLGSALVTFDRGVVEIPSPLLEAVACPAALVEVGTLAWPGDAEALTTPQGRKRIAAAVVAAAEQYFSAPSE